MNNMNRALLILLFCIGVNAQVSHYTYSVANFPYIAVNGTSSTATGINGLQDNIPIGFTFNFANVDYTTFSISTNGFIRLGKPITPGPSSRNNNLRNNANHGPMLAPLWDYNNRGTGTISYRIIGAPPNRMLEVGWHNVNIGLGVASETFFASFKVRLFEFTNKIEFIYGSSLNAAGELSASVGIGDEASFLSLTPGISFQSSSVVSNNTISDLENLEGKRIIFTPPPACTGAIAFSTIIPSYINTCFSEAPKKIKAVVQTLGASKIKYQWEQSFDQTTWAEVPGAMASILEPPVFTGENTYYRLRATCLTTGDVTYSDMSEIDGPAVPVNQVSNISATTLTPSTVRIKWKNGSGYRRLVIMSDTPDITPPVSGFGLPENIQNATYSGSGQQIVYDGTSTRAVINGLNCGQVYYARIYEFQRCGEPGSFDYYYNTTDTAANIITFSPAPANTVNLPVENDFSLFTGSNLSAAYPDWYEAAITTLPGTEPSMINPQGTTSTWRSSNVLGIPTAVTFLSGNTVNSWLVSPRINLSDDSVLKFKIALTDYTNANPDPLGIANTDDKLNILISTDECGSNWTPVYTFSAENTDEDLLTNVPTDFELDLSAYTGQTVQIAFQAVDGPMANGSTYDIHIGALSVTAPLSATQPFEETSLQFYPNPVSDVLTINNSTSINNATVINLLGQEVFNSQYNSTQAIIDFSQFPVGVYMVNITSEGKKQSFKVVHQ
jgi:hypothetical protein